MAILLHLGKESNNRLFSAELESLPHLFISYSEKEQLERMHRELLSQLAPAVTDGQLKLSYAGPLASLHGSIDTHNLFVPFLRDDSGNLAGLTRLGFLQSLSEEWKSRQKAVKKQGADILTPMIIFIDDLIDLVITSKKRTGTYFLHLFRNGPEVKMHFILASDRSYRNLIRQLLNPKTSFPAAPAHSLKQDSGLEYLASELVITPENLLFYKRPEELNYTRLFLLNEDKN